MSEAADTLYAASPDEFMALRTALVKQLKQAGDGEAAKAAGALRKPTLAASVVNRLVLDDPSQVDALLDLGARLRTAHEALDAAALRELTGERRRLVAASVRDAFALTGRPDPPAGLRDEVSSTLDAAIADPSVAQRLGRLTRSEHWSGFGVAATGPDLTLVRGGRAAGPAKRTKAEPTGATSGPSKAAAGREKPAGTTKATPTQRAATQRAERAVAKARGAFDDADATLQAAERTERDTSARIRTLSDQLTELQQQLTDAKVGLTRIRREVKSARARRREARSALDRAERKAGG